MKPSWSAHENHANILAEFYSYNKYYFTEQMKDSLLDAIECLRYVDGLNQVFTGTYFKNN